MNISGIRPADGFYEKNTEKVMPEISAPITDSNVTEEDGAVISRDRDVAASLTISAAGKAAAKNIAEAVGNMEKDTAIHRYQYLVKTNDEITEDEDRGLENFTL